MRKICFAHARVLWLLWVSSPDAKEVFSIYSCQENLSVSLFWDRLFREITQFVEHLTSYVFCVICVAARKCKFDEVNEENWPEEFRFQLKRSILNSNQLDAANCIRWPDWWRSSSKYGEAGLREPQQHKRLHCVRSLGRFFISVVSCESRLSNLVEYYTIMALVFYLVC